MEETSGRFFGTFRSSRLYAFQVVPWGFRGVPGINGELDWLQDVSEMIMGFRGFRRASRMIHSGV